MTTKLRRDYPQIAPTAGSGYVRAIRAGDTLYISGCTAIFTLAAHAGIVEQGRVALERIRGIVEAEGLTSADVVRLTTFVTDIAQYRAHATAWLAMVQDVFRGGPYPANSLIGCAALVNPDLLVEIDAVAVF